MIAPAAWTSVGIDPGATGAVAWLDGEGVACGVLLDTGDPTALRDALAPLASGARRVHVGVEKVSAWPGMGVVGAFRFGGAFVGPRVACAMLGLPVSLVLPQRWNDVAFEGRARPKEKADRKRAALAGARERWPSADLKRVKDGAIAEALWIALYVARREFLIVDRQAAEAAP